MYFSLFKISNLALVSMVVLLNKVEYSYAQDSYLINDIIEAETNFDFSDGTGDFMAIAVGSDSQPTDTDFVVAFFAPDCTTISPELSGTVGTIESSKIKVNIDVGAWEGTVNDVGDDGDDLQFCMEITWQLTVGSIPLNVKKFAVTVRVATGRVFTATTVTTAVQETQQAVSVDEDDFGRGVTVAVTNTNAALSPGEPLGLTVESNGATTYLIKLETLDVVVSGGDLSDELLTTVIDTPNNAPQYVLATFDPIDLGPTASLTASIFLPFDRFGSQARTITISGSVSFSDIPPGSRRELDGIDSENRALENEENLPFALQASLKAFDDITATDGAAASSGPFLDTTRAAVSVVVVGAGAMVFSF